jgi:hypothetical protein
MTLIRNTSLPTSLLFKFIGQDLFRGASLWLLFGSETTATFIHITCNTHDANTRHWPWIYTYLAVVSEPNSNQRDYWRTRGLLSTSGSGQSDMGQSDIRTNQETQVYKPAVQVIVNKAASSVITPLQCHIVRSVNQMKLVGAGSRSCSLLHQALSNFTGAREAY